MTTNLAELSNLIPHQPLFLPREAGALLRCHRETIKRAIRANRLRAVRIGRGWAIPRAEVLRLLQEGLTDVWPRFADRKKQGTQI